MQVVKGDLFKSPYIDCKDTMILHCISSDYALGAGFAKELESRYHVRDYLKMVGKNIYPDVIPVDSILNMVTKDKYWNKPTYETFNQGLILAREYCLQHGIKRLIMPMIGAGLDRLNWNSCYENIKYLVDEFDIDCIVYIL